MTTLILSHGDKGGVGKSTVATIIASRLYEHGENMAVIETDARNSGSNAGGVPDVGPRFSGRVEDIITLPLSDSDEDAEQSVAKLIQVIETLANKGIEYIVMNTPASASSVIEQEAVGIMIGALLADIGVNLRVTYSLFPSEDSTATAAAAFAGHVVPTASQAVLVTNRYLGKLASFDRHLRASEAMKNVPRVELPKASSDIAQLIVDNKQTNLAELSSDAESLDRATRFRIKRWYNDAADRLLDGIEIDLTTEESRDGEQR